MDEFGDFFQYLPISNDLLHSGFYVTSVGRSAVRPDAPNPTSTHPSLYHFEWSGGRVLPEFQLILITNGAGIFETRAKKPVSLTAGMAVLLTPGLWHRYRPDSGTGRTEKWVQFNGAFAHQLFDRRVVSAERCVIRLVDFQAANAAMDRLLASVFQLSFVFAAGAGGSCDRDRQRTAPLRDDAHSRRGIFRFRDRGRD